jgi:osmotically-inducible protein OsmY
MNRTTRTFAIAALAGATLIGSGCAVMRGQETVGAYVDDKVIATTVKAKLLEDKTVGGMSVNVDSLNGTVALSGFAKSNVEKAQAEYIARNTRGVRDVRNNLVVRP